MGSNIHDSTIQTKIERSKHPSIDKISLIIFLSHRKHPHRSIPVTDAITNESLPKKAKINLRHLNLATINRQVQLRQTILLQLK